MFPVTILDRQEIQRGLRALPEEQRKRIERTAAEQVTALTVAAPRLNTNHFIDQWPEEDIDRIIERFDTWHCPALEQDGTCSLYEFRPLVCRSMGVPPVIRLSKVIREEENLLARVEAEEIETLRHRLGVKGEELFLPHAFLCDPEVGEMRAGVSSSKSRNAAERHVHSTT